MISTDLQRVQIQDIIEYQLPAFVRDDFPLVGEFLKQYYISQEYPTAPSDIIQNIDEYVKLERDLTRLEGSMQAIEYVAYGKMPGDGNHGGMKDHNPHK